MSNRHTIMVAGFDYHQSQLRGLLTEKNYEYSLPKNELLDDCGYDEDDRIYQYERATYPLHIQAEPDNPYDSQAVRVYAGDTFIGYVPRGKLGDLIHLSAVPNLSATVEIFGGRYKYLEYDDSEDYYGERDPKHFQIRTEDDPVKAIMVFEW